MGGVALAEPQSSYTADAARTKSETGGSVLTQQSGTVSVLKANRLMGEDGGIGSHTIPAPGPGSGTTSGVTPVNRLIVKPRLEVVRGEKLGVSFVVLEGRNLIGRTVVSPVDIDLTGQEPVERVWSSRQHACLIFDGQSVVLEDLNSLNGTFVNRQRLFPGQQRVLHPNDVIQIGTVQLRLLISADRVDV
jgi:hypothetical protein